MDDVDIGKCTDVEQNNSKLRWLGVYARGIEVPRFDVSF